MQHVAGDCFFYGLVTYQLFVNRGEIPPRAMAVINSFHHFKTQSAKTYFLAVNMIFSSEFINGATFRKTDFSNGRGKFFTYPLIGINGKYPVIFCLGGTEVFGKSIASPFNNKTS